MIKGNVIKFGYGDIRVRSCGLGYIEFTNIKPPLEPGQSITKEIDKNLEFGLSIIIYEDEMLEIYDLVKTVNKDNRIIKYKGYTLDFSNYNEKSVKVLIHAAYNTINLRCLAC